MTAKDLYLQKREEQREKCLKLLDDGVIIWNVEDTYIDKDVEIAPGVEILPGCVLRGSTRIEENVILGPRTMLTNCTVKEGASVMETVGQDCEIGENASVGPFTYIRPGTTIGAGCRIGDFVELKNANIGDGTKVSHLTYVGDADVGRGVNFGCGTVTVNYDGKHKYRTSICDGAFIGCNTNLVAPVNVGEGAYIAAGSTITDDIPNETLAIARARQVIKGNWKDKRK